MLKLHGLANKEGVRYMILENIISRNVTSISIPNGVTRIGSNAFTNCTSLTTIL